MANGRHTSCGIGLQQRSSGKPGTSCPRSSSWDTQVQRQHRATSCLDRTDCGPRRQRPWPDCDRRLRPPSSAPRERKRTESPDSARRSGHCQIEGDCAANRREARPSNDRTYRAQQYGHACKERCRWRMVGPVAASVRLGSSCPPTSSWDTRAQRPRRATRCSVRTCWERQPPPWPSDSAPDRLRCATDARQRAELSAPSLGRYDLR